MYLLWLFRLWYCSKCLAVMNCSAVALWYCSMNKSDSLFYCFILMIIVKKIQNPNIFFTFSKKYYWLHNYHDHQCRFTMILAEKHKNTSTCTKKWYFLINEFQKNTIFTPIFVYFLYYFSALIPLITYIYIREKNKKIKQKNRKNRKKFIHINIYARFCAFCAILNSKKF